MGLRGKTVPPFSRLADGSWSGGPTVALLPPLGNIVPPPSLVRGRSDTSIIILQESSELVEWLLRVFLDMAVNAGAATQEVARACTGRGAS